MLEGIGVPSEMKPIVETMDVWAPALALRSPPSSSAGALAYETVDGLPAGSLAFASAADLVDNATERNVFAEPWMLQAASEHLLGSKEVRVLVSAQGPDIVGMLPVAISSRAVRLPVAEVWTHLHNFETTPLVRAGRTEHFLDDLFAWLLRYNVAILRWPRMSLDSRFAEEFFDYLTRTGRALDVIASSGRPMLFKADHSRQANVDRVLSNSRRRKVDRCRRRLSELGEVAFRTMDGARDCDRWLSEFLRLEASGWKGAAGAATALACRAEERAYFKCIFHEAARRDQLVVHRLELDGRPIAMTVNYRSGDRVWAYKTAYDEAYARFGPGVMVELAGTLQLIEDPRVSWADSCSDPDNLVMHELWPDRRSVGDLIIAVQPGPSIAIPALAGAERVYLGAKQQARSGYWRFRDWRRKTRIGGPPANGVNPAEKPASRRP